MLAAYSRVADATRRYNSAQPKMPLFSARHHLVGLRMPFESRDRRDMLLWLFAAAYSAKSYVEVGIKVYFTPFMRSQ